MVIGESEALRGAFDVAVDAHRGQQRHDGSPYIAHPLTVCEILATRGEPERIEALDERLAATPPFRGLRVTDERSLRCAYRDDAAPYVVHQYVRKPWLEATYHGVYSRLLRRLLIADDVAVRPPQARIPLRMRTGALARAERVRVNAVDFLRWHLGDRLPRPIATRVEDLRRLRSTGSP